MPPHCAHVIYGVGNISPPHHRVALPDAVMRKMVTQQRKSPPFSLSLSTTNHSFCFPHSHITLKTKKKQHPDTPHGEVCVFCFLFFLNLALTKVTTRASTELSVEPLSRTDKLLTSRNGEQSQQRQPAVHHLACVRARKVFTAMESGEATLERTRSDTPLLLTTRTCLQSLPGMVASGALRRTALLRNRGRGGGGGG